MTYSLGLTLYNLAGRPGRIGRPARPDRPRGPLVWLHAPGAEALTALQELARHLLEEDGVQTLITSPATPARGRGPDCPAAAATTPDAMPRRFWTIGNPKL